MIMITYGGVAVRPGNFRAGGCQGGKWDADSCGKRKILVFWKKSLESAFQAFRVTTSHPSASWAGRNRSARLCRQPATSPCFRKSRKYKPDPLDSPSLFTSPYLTCRSLCSLSPKQKWIPRYESPALILLAF